MKGYQKLKTSNQLYKIEDLKYDFEKNFKYQFNSKTRSNFEYSDSESIFKTTVLNYILDNKFNKFILFSYGLCNKVFFPAPPEIVDFIDRNYFKTNKFICSLLWIVILNKTLFKNIYNLFKISQFLFNYKKQNLLKYDQIIFINSLSSGNFNFNCSSFNVINWIKKHFTKSENQYLFIHSNLDYKKKITYNNISIVFLQYPIINSKLSNNFFKIANYLSYNFFNIFKKINRNWFESILFKENLIFNLSNENNIIFDKIFCNNSDYISRPLWTYNSNYNSNLFFYFYSTNYLKFNKNKDEYNLPVGYYSMKWPNYIFWNQSHLNHFSKFKNVIKSSIINHPVSLSDTSSDINLDYNDHKIISLFNVQPLSYHNYIDHCLSGIDDYYNYDNCIKFYSDIINLIKDKKVILLIKEKRFNSDVDDEYIKYINKIKLLPFVKLIHHEFSPYKLINISDLIISIPYTSTALIADHLNKPSIYFDPTNLINSSHFYDIDTYNSSNIAEYINEKI